MTYAEDRCIRICIDCNDLFCFLHSGAVLYGTGDADRHVKLRPDGDPRLADLAFMRVYLESLDKPWRKHIKARQLKQAFVLLADLENQVPR